MGRWSYVNVYLLAVKTSSFKSLREVEHNYEPEIVLTAITASSDIKVLSGSC